MIALKFDVTKYITNFITYYFRHLMVGVNSSLKENKLQKIGQCCELQYFQSPTILSENLNFIKQL